MTVKSRNDQETKRPFSGKERGGHDEIFFFFCIIFFWRAERMEPNVCLNPMDDQKWMGLMQASGQAQRQPNFPSLHA